MKHLIAIIVLSLAAGQSTPLHAQEGKAVSQVEIPNEAVNRDCEIVLKKSKSKSTETNAGKIVRFDETKVVLVNATRTVRVEKSVPILGAIPNLGKLFRNTGIGVENLPGELTIDRSEIRSIKFDQ
jgi:ribosomal protein L14